LDIYKVTRDYPNGIQEAVNYFLELASSGKFGFNGWEIEKSLPKSKLIKSTFCNKHKAYEVFVHQFNDEQFVINFELYYTKPAGFLTKPIKIMRKICIEFSPQKFIGSLRNQDDQVLNLCYIHNFKHNLIYPEILTFKILCDRLVTEFLKSK
jgi:hypothetical protein